jgi:hypothetical protein
MCVIVCFDSAMNDAETIDSGWGGAADPGSSATPGIWQVNTRGRKVTAMTETELASSYRAGKLTGRSLVWGEGMSEWMPLGDIAQLAKLLRDSEPPQSGTRPRLDELASGTEAYAASPDVTTNTGGLAVYERPLAMIEFPERIEQAEPADEPTPSFAIPTATPTAKAKATVDAPRPRVAGRKPPDIRAVERKSSPAKALRRTPPPAADDTHEEEPETIRPQARDAKGEDVPRIPPAPAVPSIRETLPGPLFPAPVLASPLAAALSSATPAASAPTATSTPLPPTTRPRTPLPTASFVGGSAPSAAAAPQPPATAPEPPAARPKTPVPAAALPPPPPLPHELTASDLAPAAPPAFVDATALVKPPRPAIEFLPPIIVHSKEDDDGASGILELPLHGALQEAPFHESTLVLSGRRRARRWIPLQAVMALCVGVACFASALTAFVVRTRPAPPARVVEKIVTVPAAPVERVVPAPASTEASHAPVATRTPEAEPKAPAPAAPTRAASSERSSAKAESAKVASSESTTTRSKESLRQEPGTATSEEAKPRREARAGFPTSPGF